MDERDLLAGQFEAHREHLRAVAYRMLGSLSEADDAVQEAWLRLGRADAGEIGNLGGWLTTVVARISLDMLRSRKSRREEPLDSGVSEPVVTTRRGTDPEYEAVMADSVGLAMLVVLETLEPAERLAFVLHDMFALPYDEIAPIVGRTPVATRQLASRARRRVQGADSPSQAGLSGKRKVIDAFLAAARGGDFAAMIAVLDPNIVLRTDRSVSPADTRREIRGAEAVAGQAMRGGARAARPALINGDVGVVVAPRGRLLMVLNFTVGDNGKVIAIDAIADPDHLSELTLAVIPD
ncbi:MAG TPA: sigma-70 family RNA polymerase sigma factor [Thermomicrobiales bacterium]|nr:sigma-70 family RNA polymerase sigma factor [Thermomicrobiales bacterium]